MRRSGFVMILALVFMLVLAAMVMALAYFITSETKGVGFQLDDTKALYLAQAGVERAFREIRDEVLTPTQTGVADLRGATTSTTGSGVSYVARIRYIGEGTGLGGSATIAGSGTANLRRFDSNYTQTRIISVFLYARASRATGGTGATLQVSYSTNNGATFTTAITQALPNTTTLNNYSADITGALTWPTIVNPGETFILRAARTAGNRAIYLDAIWLRVTYAIDTNTQDWYTGTYDTFPKTLGDGFIQSVSIVDEAGKVHLNYASQSLLRYLMQERGVASGTANTVATNIVNYRGASLTNPFDSVEELLQVTGMTQAIYSAIKDYVTVHSYINPYSYNPPATVAVSRAPININTALREVLEAIFDPLGLAAADVPRLAGDIISQCNTAPFRCYYDYFALASDMTVFTNFINSAARTVYLSSTERARILGNADSSFLITGTTYTTEFCYANTTYKVESVGKITVQGPVTNDINLRVKTIVGNDGSRTFLNYTGDTTPTGYWKESYE